MRQIIFLIIMLLGSMDIFGQSMSFYADVMVNASQSENRKLAAEHFDTLLEVAIAKEGSVNNTFSDLSSISIQYPQDSSFRMITWQIDEGHGRYVYKGYLQTVEGKLYKLGGRRGKKSYNNNQIIDITHWQGGLVYKILSPDTKPGQHYLLTFRMGNEFTKIKTLEPLSITEENITIGKKDYFVTKEDPDKNLSARISLQYSVDANARITYEESTQRFIFDNLIAVPGRLANQGPTSVPDGGYRAFEWTSEKGGHWQYIDQLYTQRNQGPLDPKRRKKLKNELFTKRN